MEDKKLRYQLYDVDTGEYRNCYDCDTITIVTGGNKDALMIKRANNKAAADRWINNGYEKVDLGKFTKTFNEWYAVMDDLTPTEIAMTNELVRYMQVGTNALVKRNNKTYMELSDLLRLSRPIMGDTSSRAAIKGLLSHEILTTHTNIQGQTIFYVNCYMFLKGTYANKTLLSLWRGYKRRCAT